MKIKFGFLIFLSIAFLGACKKYSGKTDIITPPPPTIDTTSTLKGVSPFPIGFAIDYAPFKNDPLYLEILKREADNVTFRYNMKHGAIVKDDGTFDFSLADELYGINSVSGLGVFGHTLAWHQNQNGVYLRSLTGSGTSAQVAASIDTALSRFIRSTVTRYAGKVQAWDVVNEPMTDGLSGVRTSGNTPIIAGANDYFSWSDFLGRDYALKAFNYAKAADPNALLFINDYNLEYNPTKLDSLLNYVKELQAKGAKIDGIGTQMHIAINVTRTGIDNMFQKLAATGLKIRVSELDVRINPSDAGNFVPTPPLLETQAEVYKYVVESFMRNIPADRRYGFTIWGVSDRDSWINTVLMKTDNPLLFYPDYNKKAAFYALVAGLKGM